MYTGFFEHLAVQHGHGATALILSALPGRAHESVATSILTFYGFQITNDAGLQTLEPGLGALFEFFN